MSLLVINYYENILGNTFSLYMLAQKIDDILAQKIDDIFDAKQMFQA